MSTNPYAAPETQAIAHAAQQPKPHPRGRVRRFGFGHLIVFLALWLPFTLLVFWAVSRGLDDAAERPDVVAYTTLATITGPMVGAISRGGQGCCLEASLSLLPYCAPALVLAFVVQLAWRPGLRVFTLVRLLLWAVGWSIWFGGGIVSLGHALS